MAQITLSVTLAVTVAVAQVPNEQDVAPGATINLDAGDTPCWAGGSHSCTQFRGQSDAWVAPVSPANYSGLTDGSHTFSLVGQISGGRRATRVSTHGWWIRCLRQCLWLPCIPPIRPAPPMQRSLFPMRSRASPSCAAWMVPRRFATGSQPTWCSLMAATHSLLLQRTPPEIKARRTCSVGRSTPRPRRLRTSTAHSPPCRIRLRPHLRFRMRRLVLCSPANWTRHSQHSALRRQSISDWPTEFIHFQSLPATQIRADRARRRPLRGPRIQRLPQEAKRKHGALEQPPIPIV